MRRQVTTIIAVAGLSLSTASVAGAQPMNDSQPEPTSAVGQSQLRITDPRSPDARDAQNIVVVPSGVIAKSSPTTPSAHDSSNGFGWDDAGLGAGGLVLIASLAFGAGYVIRHRGPRAPLAH
jgi:hypothetical protein